jgi:hypothetical protein
MRLAYLLSSEPLMPKAIDFTSINTRAPRGPAGVVEGMAW